MPRKLFSLLFCAFFRTVSYAILFPDIFLIISTKPNII